MSFKPLLVEVLPEAAALLEVCIILMILGDWYAEDMDIHCRGVAKTRLITPT